LYSAQGLILTSVHKSDYLEHIEQSKVKNVPVFLQNLSDDFPAPLMKLLLENNFENQRKKLNIFLATRLAKPNFEADIVTIVNVVNFTVKVEGLEKMFLG